MYKFISKLFKPDKTDKLFSLLNYICKKIFK